MNTFSEINPEELTENPFKLFAKEWMLITAGTKESFNTMTGAWGCLGVMWNKNICICAIRPTRHTYGFMESTHVYSLSFLEEQFRDILTYCGTRSGRDVNKVAETGLTPIFDNNAVYFAESRLVFVCKKIYYQDLLPKYFLDQDIGGFYPLKDYHRIYVGEVEKCLRKGES